MSSDALRLSDEQSQQGDVVEAGLSLNERRRIALAEIDEAAFSPLHVKICFVAGAGFFTDAYDIFAITIAVEMLGYVYGFNTSKWGGAGLKIATPIGNLIGQVLFGWLADILGRKRMYGVELAIMIIATFGQAVSGEGPRLNIVGILIFWRVIMGIGVGGDYPLSAIITSEFASTRIRGRLMTAVFSFQGLGQLAATLVALAIVVAYRNSIEHSTDALDSTWRLLIGLGCIPAVIALYFRLTIPETPRFIMDVDRKIGRAARDINNVLTSGYSIYHDDDDSISEARVPAPRASIHDFVSHFSRWENFKVLLGTAYSWFALDIAFYILALDIPPILNAINLGTVDGDPYRSLYRLCIGTLILTVAGYIPGFVASFFLIDLWGRKPLQLMGFLVLTVLFLIMGFDLLNLPAKVFMAFYCLSNFFLNFGPNTTTFIVPGEVFPTRYRSTAHGISAASGKLGAVISQILFTVTQQQANLIGVNKQFKLVLSVLSFVMLTGVFSTLLIPETKKRALEELSNEDQKTFIPLTATSASQRV